MNGQDERFESVDRLECLTHSQKEFLAAHAISTFGQALEFVEKALRSYDAMPSPEIDHATLIALRRELLERLPDQIVSEIRKDAGAQWMKSFRPGVPIDDPTRPTRDRSPLSFDLLRKNKSGDTTAESGDSSCDQ